MLKSKITITSVISRFLHWLHIGIWIAAHFHEVKLFSLLLIENKSSCFVTADLCQCECPFIRIWMLMVMGFGCFPVWLTCFSCHIFVSVVGWCGTAARYCWAPQRDSDAVASFDSKALPYPPVWVLKPGHAGGGRRGTAEPGCWELEGKPYGHSPCVCIWPCWRYGLECNKYCLKYK